MEIPTHQKIIRWIGYIIIGIFAIGGVLDSISNSISLITSSVTYWGTVIIFIIFISIFFYLRKKPISWVINQQNIKISKLGIKPTLMVLGCVLLLWVPRVVDLFTDNPLKTETETEGYLIPANDPNPPNSCNSVIPKDALVMYFGDSVAYTSQKSYPIIILDGQDVFSIYQTQEGLSVNYTMRSQDGRIIAKIEGNKFVVNRNNILNRERPDKHTLIVNDEFGKKVLYVRFLNESSVKILGIFYRPSSLKPL